MRAMSFFVAMVVLLAMVSICSAATLVPLNEFATSTDFTSKFTTVCGSVSYDSSDDGGVGAGGFITTIQADHSAVVYDTNAAPGGAGDIFGQQFTIDVDLRVDEAESGAGFYFLGDGTRTSKNWIFYQVDAPYQASTDRVRFFSGRDMTSGSGGSMVRDEYTAGNLLTTGQWIHLRLDVDVNESNQAVATLSGYNSQTVFDSSTLQFEKSHTYAAGNTTMSEIGLEVFGNGVNSADMDNFTVTGVPEPCSMAILVTGLVGLIAYAWRKRR